MHREARRALGEASDPAELAPDAGGIAVVRALVRPRAKAVYLPPSFPWKGSVADLAHETRVASRRLESALELAAPMLDGRVRKALARDARWARRAFGPRRQADVLRGHVARLTREAGNRDAIGAAVLERLDAQAAAATRSARARLTRARLARAWERAVELSTAPVPHLTWRDLGGFALHSRAEEVFELIDALEDADARETHHASRLRFERLRYTFELLQPIFPEEMAEVPDEALVEIQDALGNLQDAYDLDALLRSKDPLRLGKKTRRALRELTETWVEGRRETAREVTGRLGPGVLAASRRAAGSIGQIVAPMSVT